MSPDSFFFILFLKALSAVLVVFYIVDFLVVDYLMKRFGSARYLPLKIGTNCKVFDSIGFFCCR